ncbi:hypothetical protein RB653_008352 [Dictyostelium firmibasis]|uniref:Isopentenyl phosphate kinase n=1 Tax=Dictyostelium firmibasis TaxID=79012 RepID=A0AAN7TSG6_9MYCE
MQENKQQLIIIKFGGAYISKKDKFETIWKENIENLVYIVKTLSIDYNHKVILIIGAGSFGHHSANQYKVKYGHSSGDGLIIGTSNNNNNNKLLCEGILKTRESVTTLLDIVKKELVNNGLNVCSMSPFSSWRTNNGGDNVVQHNIDNISFSLNNFPNIIPILHGDVCLDNTLGCTILSGDTIIRELCFKLKPNKCIYVSDVNGVYDSNPKENENSQLLSNIKVSENDDSNNSHDDNIKLTLDNSSKDVTGGMKAKLDSAIRVARNKTHTLIIGGSYSKNEILETILIDDPINIKKEMMNICKSLKIINYKNGFPITNVRNYCISVPKIRSKEFIEKKMNNYNKIKNINENNNNNNNKQIKKIKSSEKEDENGGLVVKKFNNSHIMERDPQDRSLSQKQYFEKLADRGDLDRMLNLVRHMPERRSSYSYEKLIYACSKARRFNESWSIYNDMKKDNIKPSIHIFGNLVHICNTATGINKNIIEERINKITNEIEKYEVQLSIPFFNILMKTFITIGRSEDALSFIDRMKKSGLKPDISTYSMWIKAASDKYLKDNKIILKSDLYNNVNNAKNTLELDELRSNGNKQIDFYMSLVKNVKASNVTPDRIFINSILQACKDTQYPAGVFQVWDTIKEMRFTKHLEADTKTYDILITTCNNVIMFEKALEYFEEIFSKNIKPDAFLINNMFRTSLKIAHCPKLSRKINLDQEAIINRTIDYMTAFNIRPDSDSFAILISTYSKLGKNEKVYELWLEMKELGIEPNVKHYSGIVSQFKNNPEKILEVLRVIVSKKIILTTDFVGFMQKHLFKGKGDTQEFSRLLREHDSYALK